MRVHIHISLAFLLGDLSSQVLHDGDGLIIFADIHNWSELAAGNTLSNQWRPHPDDDLKILVTTTLRAHETRLVGGKLLLLLLELPEYYKLITYM